MPGTEAIASLTLAASAAAVSKSKPRSSTATPSPEPAPIIREKIPCPARTRQTAPGITFSRRSSSAVICWSERLRCVLGTSRML